VHEMTTARGACASCGGIVQIGSQHLYMSPLSPGAVLRCKVCQQVLMVLVHNRSRYRLGLTGLTWIEIPEVADAVVARS
jgi:hypothetical protein